jgi:hypothetical protein
MMKDLKLEILEDGITTGLSVRNGAFLAEAASVCLFSHKHGISMNFEVDGYVKQTYNLFRIDVNDLSLNSFADLEEAAEFGAMGIAVAVINDQTGWKAVRSWKGTGFDYWFGSESEEYLFQNKLRIEVSGDLKGTDSEINSRLKKKMEQTQVSDHLSIPACAVIVEFSIPKSLTGFR